MPCLRYDPTRIAMALPAINAEHSSETEDLESEQKIVKFVVVKKREESHAEKED